MTPKSILSMENIPEKWGIGINKESTLKREWFVLRDELSPAVINGATGISVLIGVPTTPGGNQYQVPFEIRVKEPVTAVEIRVHILDVFGKVVSSLSATEVSDISDKKHFVANWPVYWSRSEPMTVHASVVYVAQARTAAGRVYEVDRGAVLEQMRKISRKLIDEDLEPRRDTPSR
ncbi:MAG TPA: hypothetical protein VEC35_12885 [Noviherbaspirillum sp.]|nr:hypothetical protein [Noviherbaspirillum sp.]